VCSQQACSQVQNMEEYAWYAEYAGYDMLLGIARGCGFPADTVKVTPPHLWTCNGAVMQLLHLSGACPTTKVSSTDENGETYDDEKHTPASCHTDECAAAISFLTDKKMACWKEGLQVSIMTVPVFESVWSVYTAGYCFCSGTSALVHL